MADNQSRAKTNPFPHHNHSSIMMNNNSAPYNSPQQHQHQGGLSLSLSFPQHAADAAPSPILLPLGPFTGYATILNTSRFLTPAQSILDDLFAFVNSHHTHHHEAEEEEASLGSELKSLGERVSDHRWNKSNLMLMLHEVSYRCREADSSSTDWFVQDPGFQLVYQCKSESMEANGGRDSLTRIRAQRSCFLFSVGATATCWLLLVFGGCSQYRKQTDENFRAGGSWWLFVKRWRFAGPGSASCKCSDQ
ncbi:hypothetical protein LINPERHAP2_LOCUS30959 [Linum perenne]